MNTCTTDILQQREKNLGLTILEQTGSRPAFAATNNPIEKWEGLFTILPCFIGSTLMDVLPTSTIGMDEQTPDILQYGIHLIVMPSRHRLDPCPH